MATTNTVRRHTDVPLNPKHKGLNIFDSIEGPGLDGPETDARSLFPEQQTPVDQTDLVGAKTIPVMEGGAELGNAAEPDKAAVGTGISNQTVDLRVSDKIRTLRAEGKPHDQSVAIALDMKRRGTL